MRLNKLHGFSSKPATDFQHERLSVPVAALRFRHEDLANADTADSPFGNEQVHADNLTARHNFQICLFLQFKPQ